MKYFKSIPKSLFYLLEDIIGGSQKKNLEIKNLYSNKRCFILCTGTSLDEISALDLRNEYTFSCNLISHWKGFKDLSLDFYSATNHFLSYDPISQKKMYSDLSHFNKNPNLKVFLRSLNKLILPQNLFKQENTYFFKPRHVEAFSSDPPVINMHKKTEYSDGVFEFQVALAMYMGFSEIYLVGCGTTYKPSLEYHFYDENVDFPLDLPWEKPVFFKDSFTKNNIDKKSKDFALRNNLSLFSILDFETYQVHRFSSNDPKVPLDKKFVRLQKLADQMNVKIYNVTPEGLDSPIFKRVSSAEVFK